MNEITTIPSKKRLETAAAERDRGGASRHIPKFIVALLSGAVLSLAFPHADIGLLAFIALAPFLSTFPYARSRTAFLNGFLCGLAYFGCLIYWIAVFAETKIGGYGIGAWFILSARESLYVGLFAVGYNYFWTRTGWNGRVIAAACLWTICEWARQLGSLGFGWGDISYSQWHLLPLIQICAVTGIWGVTWLLVAFNAALSSRQPRIILAVASLIVLVSVGGAIRIDLSKPAHEPSTAAALQTDVSEDVPYLNDRPKDSGYFYGTLNQFNTMASTAEKNDNATICVTAETSIPGYPTFDPELRTILSNIARRNNVELIVGARAFDFPSQSDTNSAFVYHPDGSVSGPYDKQQLVPFGEYVPLLNVLPFLKNFHVLDFNMHAGDGNQMPLPVGKKYKAGIAICYESTYPRFLREQVAKGATFDVVMTDDTWYGKTAAAKQHEAMSILRAVETDRSLVRCASTGISAIISPRGEVLSSAGIFQRALVAGPIEQRTDLSPFVRYGDWFVYLCIAGLIFQLFRNRLNSDKL